MRTRTCSRARTISCSSQISFLDIPSLGGHRIRNESVHSRCSLQEPVTLHSGEIVEVLEDDSVLDNELPKRPVWQLILLNAVVLGIEFCYAIETALVTPLLLQMGLPSSLYSLAWIISPTLGFFMNPVVGSLSDRCSCAWGRRRPFILALCIGIVVGFTLLLNGEDLGVLAGDTNNHTIGLIITIIGLVILDFSADSCDSPSKAYIIDVCSLPDVDRALNVRAILGGLGAGAGFVFNGIDWESNFLGRALGDQSRVMFLFTSIVCIICFTLTLISVKEKSLVQESSQPRHQGFQGGVPTPDPRKELSYDSLIQNTLDPSIKSRAINDTQSSRDPMSFSGSNGMTSDSSNCVQSTETESSQPQESVSVLKLLVSVVKMPTELRWLCLNHFLGWSGMISIFLFYTDYVGEVVYKGDATAPKDSDSRQLYEAGVKMGSWGMVIFAVSIVVSAITLDKLSRYIAPRTAYVWGQTIFAVGTGCMAIFSDSIYATLALNATSGVMFATITTLPFSIVADYHQTYQTMGDSERLQRGLGTDVACLSSINFLAQIVMSAFLGLIVSAVGSKVSVVLMASGAAFLAALTSALFVVYKVKPKEYKGLDEEQRPLIM